MDEPKKEEPKNDETPVTPPTPSASDAKGIFTKLGIHWPPPKWAKWLLFLLFAPIATFYFKDQRLAKEKLTIKPFPNSVISVVTTPNDIFGVVVYEDGKELPREGLGMSLVRWEDYKENTVQLDVIKNKKLIKEDFPIVIFLNRSGFDPTGQPITIRRSKDGSLVYEVAKLGKPIKLLAAHRGGDFTVVFFDGTQKDVDEKQFIEEHMRLPYTEPSKPVPPGLEGMTDEELKKLGYERITAEEYKKRYGRNPPLPIIKDETFPRPRPPSK